MTPDRIPLSYFRRDVLDVAPSLLGKYLVRCYDNGSVLRYEITETEAYRGGDDLACHASKGKTDRTAIMFEPGGVLYMYLIYGMYWMLNIVTAGKDEPQAVLIRGVRDVNGPGRVSRALSLNKSFYGESLDESKRIWIEDADRERKIISTSRIGIDYAGEYWKNKPWRWVLSD